MKNIRIELLKTLEKKRRIPNNLMIKHYELIKLINFIYFYLNHSYNQNLYNLVY